MNTPVPYRLRYPKKSQSHKIDDDRYAQTNRDHRILQPHAQPFQQNRFAVDEEEERDQTGDQRGIAAQRAGNIQPQKAAQGAGHAAARTGDAGGVPDRAVYLRLHQDEHIQQDRRKQRRVHQQKTDPLLFT